MENSTQLLRRQEQLLAGRRALVVEANDPALAALPAEQLYVHADDYTVGAHQWAPLPTLPDDVDLVILPLPKAAERLELLLRALAGAVDAPLELWLVGPAKGGIRGGVTRLSRFADEVTLVDSARHCKLYRALLRPGPALTLEDVASWIEVRDLRVVSYPGYSATDAWTRARPCCWMRWTTGCPGARCSTWAAGRRLERHPGPWRLPRDRHGRERHRGGRHHRHPGAQSFAGQGGGGDLYDGVAGRYQAVITNPPFHDGRERTTAITRRLIEEAPDHLEGDGVLWMVANRELPYVQWLDGAFKHVQVMRETNRFRVYRAVR